MMKKLMVTVLFIVFASSANAGIIGYNFEWTGTGGYSMTGMFTYDDADAVDGAIRDGEVVSLMFNAFLNDVLFLSNNIANLEPSFNFNFNTAAGQFFLGGDTSSDTGQAWNLFGPGFLGFGAGVAGSELVSHIGGVSTGLGLVTNPVPLTASPKVPVPAPATLALFGLGLASLGWSRRKKA